MNEAQLLQAFYDDIKEPDYPEKSVGWWFNTGLQEPYRSQAIRNTKDELLDTIRISLGTALNGFNWQGSPEGYEYWYKVLNRHDH
jgi:hypothetical protein